LIFADHRRNPLMPRIASTVAREFGFVGTRYIATRYAHAIDLIFITTLVTDADVKCLDYSRSGTDQFLDRLHAENDIGPNRLMALRPLRGAAVIVKPGAPIITAIFHAASC
jgi:hypothetical protein